MPKNSKVIIAKNIKVDRDYVNVTDADMLNVVESLAVQTANNYSFVRRDRSLKVHFSYNDCLMCNYIAFQNPAYSNKWFFAWIDDIEYIDDNCVEISFTIDQWSTWFSSFQKLPVFVEREHVMSDLFGEHNLPEPVKPDKLINSYVYRRNWSDFRIVCFYAPDQLTQRSGEYFSISNRYFTTAMARQYNADAGGINALIADLNSGGAIGNATIISVLMIPTEFISTNSSPMINNSTVIHNITMPVPQNLNGYIPLNRKCYTHPFNYLTVSNGNLEKIYLYEKFAQYNDIDFEIIAGVLPTGSASMYPVDYDGITGRNIVESLDVGDFPSVATATDSYAAWLAQKQSSTVVQGILSTLTGALAGFTTGGAAGAAIGAGMGLAGGIANYISQDVSAQAEKDRVVGTNNTSIDMLNGIFGYQFCQRCAIYDDAERIDRYFSQFGYNVSLVKIPNYTGRIYWNYVKVNGCAGYGEMPTQAINTINNVLNKGTTIWHSHFNLGDYFAGGSKMENPIG